MSDYISLSDDLPFFRPESRNAIIFNNWDNSKDVENYSIDNIIFRGNMRVDEISSILQAKLPKTWQEVSGIYDRKSMPYKSVFEVMPTTLNQEQSMKDQLLSSIDSVKSNSNDDSLLFMYITSHGEDGSFVIDNDDTMNYNTLLDHLDSVNGKKVLFTLACYSGSIISAVESRLKKNDYLIISSTSENEKGLSWCEDKLHDMFRTNLIESGKISNLKIPYGMNVGAESHHPKIFGCYDVIL